MNLLNLSPKARLICGVFALLLAVLPVSASASAHYRVWYFDTNFGIFQEGDISDGSTKLNPPGYACGMRFNDPAYYRWINSTGSNIADGNFNKDVVVWFPKPGCPQTSDVLIEYTDGSVTFPHQLGGSYMEITTNYGVRWVDEDGEVPSCNCTGPSNFKYFMPYDTGTRLDGIFTLKTALLLPDLQPYTVGNIVALEDDLETLATELQKQVKERRRSDLGDLEASVRSLEDNARRRLAEAAEDLEACRAEASQTSFVEAYVNCDLGAENISAAASLLDTAQYLFEDVD